MRIACANWTRRHAGGVESYLSFLVPRLREAGHDVRLWSECDLPSDRPLIGDVEEWCVDADGRDAALGGLRKWDPAVILVHGLVDPSIEAQLLGVGPAVFFAHSYYGTCISGGKTLTFPAPVPCSRTFGPACLLMFYPRRCGGLSPVTMAREYAKQARRLSLLRAYGHVLTLSSHMRAEYLRHGFDPESVTALPPYVPSAGVDRSGSASAGDPARALRLLYLGRIDRLKGCRLLIEALPLVRARLERPVHLELAGEGPDRHHCAGLAESLRDPHVNVRQAGWLDADARSAALLDADVVVVPSLWPEPYGLAGLEAVTAGVPVAAFATGGVPEWLEDGVTGALAPAHPPTAAGLAAAICRSAGLERRMPLGTAAIDGMAATHVRALVGALERIASGHAAEPTA